MIERTDRVQQVDYLRQLVADAYSNSQANLEDYEGDAEAYARGLVEGMIMKEDDMPEWVRAHDLYLLLRFAKEIIDGT